MTERRRLVINADDFGMSRGINRGILEAFEAGALRSTSLMANMPAFEDAASASRSVGDALGVGVHLTLTVGRPLTRCPSLVDARSGAFLSLARLCARALTGRVQATEVAAECAAQVAQCRAAGIPVTHLDSHHHVHALPGIRGVVTRVAREQRIPVRRRPFEHPSHNPRWGTLVVRGPDGAALSDQRLPARIALRLMARGLLDDRPFLCSADHFVGVALRRSANFQADLIHVLETLRDGITELMVHPGYVDGPLPGGDAYTDGRERELRALTAPEVTERLRRGDIELVKFG